MKPKKLWQIKACLVVLLLICGALLVASFLLNDKLTWLFAVLFIIMVLVTVLRFRFLRIRSAQSPTRSRESYSAWIAA